MLMTYTQELTAIQKPKTHIALVESVDTYSIIKLVIIARRSAFTSTSLLCTLYNYYRPAVALILFSTDCCALYSEPSVCRSGRFEKNLVTKAGGKCCIVNKYGKHQFLDEVIGH